MVQVGHEESARRVDNNCKCHLMIDEVSIESNNNGTSIKCKMSVLGSTDPAQVGKTVTEFFKCDGKASGMFLNLSEAAQLITREQRNQAQQQGVGMNIDESLLKGRQICATINLEQKQVRNPVTGKYEPDPSDSTMYARIGFETYGIWDKKAEGIPLDRQFASMVPKPAHYNPGTNGGAAGATAGTTPSNPNQPPAGTQQQLPLTGPQNLPTAPSMNW